MAFVAMVVSSFSLFSPSRVEEGLLVNVANFLGCFFSFFSVVGARKVAIFYVPIHPLYTLNFNDQQIIN